MSRLIRKKETLHLLVFFVFNQIIQYSKHKSSHEFHFALNVFASSRSSWFFVPPFSAQVKPCKKTKRETLEAYTALY